MQKIRYFFQLLKLRLSLTVVFSALTGYFLGASKINLSQNLSEVFYLALGGFLVVGSANAFNQILEKDYDRLMKRTACRPLVRGNLQIWESIIFSFIIGLLGLIMLHQINSYCSYYGLLSIILYVLCYTPLKRISPISIFVGAIPGAIPFLLGWVAAYPDKQGFEMASGILFAIQFFWQFPHFIAISWVQDEDYKKAGFKMMIGGEKGKSAIIVSIITSLFLMAISVTPFFIKDVRLSMSLSVLIVVVILNILFIFKSIQLYINQDNNSAKNLMISSFFYLPLLQILLVLDKYLLIS